MSAQYFVGIGAQRTGTTWLANYFSHHPQVCFSAIKELHYFDAIYRPDLCSLYNENHFNNQLQEIKTKMDLPGLTLEESLQSTCLQYRIKMIEEKEKYKEYFNSLLKSEHRAFGEITPSYSLLNINGFNAILNLYPNAKFIFILRNPCDRYWSHLNLHDDRFEHFSAIEQVINCLDNPQYFLRTDYKRTITTLRNTINDDNLLFLFFERLFNTQTLPNELKRITNFLNIDYINPDIKPLNESKKNPLPVCYRKRIFQHFRFVYQFVNQIFPNQIPESWLDDLSAFSS
ncbi:MAG: sulfotransferase [Bacteroidota bacterium]